MKTHFLRKKIIPGLFLLVGLCSSVSFAAGPRPKDFYLNLGGGIFTPDFVLNKNTSLEGVDGDSAVTFVGISVPYVGVDKPLTLVGLAADGDTAGNQPENRSILSLGGVLGYKYNRNFNFEAHLDLGFPVILIKDLHLANILDQDTQQAATVRILAPDLLPIGASVTYTLLPDALISPYVGVGAIIAMLDNRRAHNEATDILVIDGGVEIGYLIHAGAFMDLSNIWYGFADFKFASIDSPDFTTRQGISAPVDRLDIRHIRVGAGMRF